MAGLENAKHGCGRRQWLVSATALPALGWLAGCAALETQDLVFSETDLALMLARQFPQSRKVLEVIELQVANPHLTLQPERNRVATSFDLIANDRLFGNHASGHLMLDYALRFDAADHSVRMKDVRVQSLSLDSGSSTLRGQAQRLGILASEHLLENLAIYKMKPEQADRMDRFGLEARSVAVTARGLEVHVGPKAR